MKRDYHLYYKSDITSQAEVQTKKMTFETGWFPYEEIRYEIEEYEFLHACMMVKDYPQPFSLEGRYAVTWEEFIPSYTLIKVKQLSPLYDLFALESTDTESFAVFIGSMKHLFNGRKAEINYVLDFQISDDEQFMIRLCL